MKERFPAPKRHVKINMPTGTKIHNPDTRKKPKYNRVIDANDLPNVDWQNDDIDHDEMLEWMYE